MVAFQPPHLPGCGLVLVPTQGLFVVRGGGRLFPGQSGCRHGDACQAASGSGVDFGGGGV